MITLPPPPAHVWLLNEAVDYYRGLGIRIPGYVVTGGEPRTTDAIASVFTPADGSPPTVRLSRRMVGSPRAALSITVLHEVGHLAQRTGILTEWRAGAETFPWYEGMTDAVAHDQVCPFMARVWGRVVAVQECRGWSVAYPREVAEFRSWSARMSGDSWPSYAARSWRLNTLREVSLES